MAEHLRYEPIDPLSWDEVEERVATGGPDLHKVPIAVSLYADDPARALELLLTLATHEDGTVRGNALLGFGHLARRFWALPRERVDPLLQAGLSDPHPHVRRQAHYGLADVDHFAPH